MSQLSLTDARLQKRRKKTRKKKFLDEVNAIIPSQRLLDTIAPYYREATRGCQRSPLATVLPIHMLQHFLNYYDPAMKVSLYCQFIVSNPPAHIVRNETKLCKFRYLLERHQIADAFLAEIYDELIAYRLLFNKGNHWNVGMNANVDSDAIAVWCIFLVFTNAKAPNDKVFDDLLHGEEEAASGDKAYTNNVPNLLASNPDEGQIWSMAFKKLLG